MRIALYRRIYNSSSHIPVNYLDTHVLASKLVVACKNYLHSTSRFFFAWYIVFVSIGIVALIYVIIIRGKQHDT